MDKRKRIVFDLVEGEQEIDGADGGRGGQGGPPRSTGREVLRDLGPAVVSGMVRARGWVSRHRAVSMVATGVAAAVVLSTAAVGTVRERERIDLLRTAPGGVASLAVPPVETWRYVPDGDTSLVDPYGPATSGVTMGGNVVFLEGEQSGLNRSGLDDPYTHLRWEGADLVAVDAGTGEEAWRVPLGHDPVCTPPEAGGASRVLDEIVCLVGHADERGVVAVTADGQASEARRLAPGGALPDEVIPAWDGLVVRARSHGEAPEVDCSDSARFPSGCVVSKGDPGWGVTVRAEDARTGDEVWREELPWNGDLYPCVQAMNSADESAVDADAFLVWASGALVRVRGCGVDAAFRADGTLIAGDAALSASGRLIFGQEYDYENNEVIATVRTADGNELLTTNGWPVEGDASDGTPSGAFVVAADQGRTLQGYRLDGVQAWELENTGEAMVAQVGPIGVFRRFDAGWTALDLRSGDVLWEWSAGDVGVHGTGQHASAFTDGRTVMQVHLSDPLSSVEEEAELTGGRAHLVAVDARTGRVRWEVARDDPYWFAAAGQLLSVADDGSLAGYRG